MPRSPGGLDCAEPLPRSSSVILILRVSNGARLTHGQLRPALSVPPLEWLVDDLARQESGQQPREAARVEPLGAGQDLVDLPPSTADIVLKFRGGPAAVDNIWLLSRDPGQHHHLVLEP